MLATPMSFPSTKAGNVPFGPGDGNDSCVILHYVESHPAIFLTYLFDFVTDSRKNIDRTSNPGAFHGTLISPFLMALAKFSRNSAKS
jgi:hypothetical protein